MEIRRVDPGEWEPLRDIRLRALADAPYAFATTYEEALDRPDSYWHEMLREPAWIAEDGGLWWGMVRVRSEDDDTAHLISMWIDPEVRARGVGRRLVQAVEDWARDRDLRTVVLWVAEGNRAAEALYRSAGFEGTGERQPLPSDPSVSETMMRLDLGPGR